MSGVVTGLVFWAATCGSAAEVNLNSRVNPPDWPRLAGLLPNPARFLTLPEAIAMAIAEFAAPVSPIFVENEQSDSDRPRADIERQVNNLLLNTEIAYWHLYQAYGALDSKEKLCRQMNKTRALHKANRDANLKNHRSAHLPPFREHLAQCRQERTKALSDVQEAERNLRRMISLKLEDGTSLVPVTPPMLAPLHPNWAAARDDALKLRPELILARQDLSKAGAGSLEGLEIRAIGLLSMNYQKLKEWYSRIEICLSETECYAKLAQELWHSCNSSPARAEDLTNLATNLVYIQRRLALALEKEYEAIAEYNITQARFEWARGTIRQRDRICLPLQLTK